MNNFIDSCLVYNRVKLKVACMRMTANPLTIRPAIIY